jgi:hypothetical protein
MEVLFPGSSGVRRRFPIEVASTLCIGAELYPSVQMH